MALTIATTFGSVSTGSPLLVRPMDSFTWVISGTFVGTWVLEASGDGGKNWGPMPIAPGQQGIGTTTKSGNFQNLFGMVIQARFRCKAYTSGSIVTTLTEDDTEVAVVKDQTGATLIGQQPSTRTISTLKRVLQKRLTPVSVGHVGATAGFVTRAAADTDLTTVPASQTGSTFVIPVAGLKVGDTITAFHLIGELTSAGGTVTIDCVLKAHTAASGTDAAASIQSMTQISKTANNLVDEVLSLTPLATPEIVAQDKTYFYLVTVTTGASCTVTLNAAATVVTET